MPPVKIPGSDLKGIQDELNIKGALDFISAGGFKAVYKAEINGKIEALKILPIPETDDEKIGENIKRIQREISLLQNCKSKYLVKLGTIEPRYIKAGNKHYVVYSEEMLTGKPVNEKIKEGYKPKATELAMLMLCAIDVIKNLWGEDTKVIHRDIKPNNVFYTGEKSRPFVLLDLGIAFVLDETGITGNTMNIPGTLYYLAPEMLKRGFRQAIDFRADLYATALTAYEYASSVNPFVRRDDVVYTTMTRIAKDKPKPLEELRNNLPKELCGLIDQLLSKLPALRPSNLNILEKKLREFL